MRAGSARRRRAGFCSTERFDEGCDTFEAASGGGFGQAPPERAGTAPPGGRAGAGRLRAAAADAAVGELDDSEELEGVASPYRAARAAAGARRRAGPGAREARPGGTEDGEAHEGPARGHGEAPGGAAEAPAGTRRDAARSPAAAARGKRAPAREAMRRAQLRRNYAASRAAAAEAAEPAARGAAGRRAAALAGKLAPAAPAVGAALALAASVALAATMLSGLLGATFGFWESEASKASLEGLPPYVTYEMLEAALECQEEYGHPAGCTIAQIIVESGQGDRMSRLAERDGNLFGIKWSPGFALCPEVAGKASWATSEVLDGREVTVTADFTVFKGPEDCIRFRSRVLLASDRYAGNPLIREAVEGRDSDKMAEGLAAAGWATSPGYADSLKAAMEAYGLYRLDAMGPDDLLSRSAPGDVIVAAAYSQLGVPYVWGGSTPGVGLDCSGLTQYCYAQAGIRISHYTEDQRRELTAVPLSQARPGDILYRPGHVAIYVGDDKYIHEPHTGDVCRVATGIGSFTCALRHVS